MVYVYDEIYVWTIFGECISCFFKLSVLRFLFVDRFHVDSIHTSRVYINYWFVWCKSSFWNSTPPQEFSCPMIPPRWKIVIIWGAHLGSSKYWPRCTLWIVKFSQNRTLTIRGQNLIPTHCSPGWNSIPVVNRPGLGTRTVGFQKTKLTVGSKPGPSQELAGFGNPDSMVPKKLNSLSGVETPSSPMLGWVSTPYYSRLGCSFDPGQWESYFCENFIV